MNFINKLKMLLPLALLIISPVLASEDLEISKDFALFTSKNLQGYTKPLITTLGEAFNSNLHTKAVYPEHWTIALDISLNGAFIPDDQKSFDAELPSGYTSTIVDNAMLRENTISRQLSGTVAEPTLYGGGSYGIFSAQLQPASMSDGQNRDSTNKSVAFAEGRNMNFVAGVPNLQIIVGIPTQTEIRLRFWGAPVQDVFMSYWAIGINQQIDQFIDLFSGDSTMGLALHFAYNQMTRSNGIDLSTMAIGAHFSKSWENGFSAYVGAQYEGLSGSFEAVRVDFDPNDVANSPYDEVRNGEDLKFDFESFTDYRITLGLAYQAGFAELHADAAWASQPILTAGIRLNLGTFGRKDDNQKETKK